MATEKVKKPRKPRKKAETGTETKPVSRRRKKTIENQVPTADTTVETKSVSSKKAVENTARNLISNAKVLFKDKIQLHELPTLTSIADSELADISVDTSHLLPYDSLVEYLEFTGPQSINTNIKMSKFRGYDALISQCSNSNTPSTSDNGYRDVIGTQYDTTRATFYMAPNSTVSSSSFNLDYSNGIYPFSGRFDTTTPIHFGIKKYDNTRIVGYIGETTQLHPAIDFPGTDDDIIFIKVGPRTEQNNNSRFRIHSFQIFESDGTLLFDGHPARLNNNGCLYDSVSRKIFENCGTGKIAYGEDIHDSIESDQDQIDKYKSIGTALYRFSGDKLSSDVPYLLDESAVKRYRTKTNNLQPIDLRLFSDYSQQGLKKTYFNDHPHIVNNIDMNSLNYDQLLTKNNLEEAERYFVNRFLNSKSKLKASNWETDSDYIKSTNGEPKQEISGLNEMLELDKWDSQATYKFEWGNDKRTTNIVDLKTNSSYYYSVIGIVSVKSKLPDQKSGTIYLEAKPREQDDIDDNWVVVDSAVFKFDQDKKNAGTYVTLTGYMSPNYVTRLKLNLHPNAYSMNNWEYREKGSVSNHYSNTFVGTAYILDDFISSETIEIPINIKFTDSNYSPYKIDNKVITADLTNDLSGYFIDSQVYTIAVSDVIEKIKENLPNSNIETLDISTKTQNGRSQFYINGLRYSPTGRIYPITSTMNLFSNCILYPSYSSGTITVQQSALHNATLNRQGIEESWQGGQVLYNLNMSYLSALPNLDWPKNTEIYGNHEISGKIEQINSSTTRTSYQYQTTNRSNPVSFNNQVVESIAQYNPRICDQLVSHKIDFSKILNKYDVVGNITCHITATPRTWGGAGGESYGVVRYGFTNDKELNDLHTTAVSTIVNPVKFVTKNITRWISNKLCTGTYWNVHEGTMTATFEQDSKYRQIWIQAVANTAKGVTKITHFSVTANVTIYFKYKAMVTGTRSSTTTETVTAYITCSTSGTRENIVQNSKIYPILSASKNMEATTRPSTVEDVFRVDNITDAIGKFRTAELTVIPYPQNISWQS